MSFLQKLIGRFQRKTEGYKAQQEDELALFTSKDLDIHHKEQREKYVRTHLEQMAESAKELEVLGYEYNLVTAYLTDMEEIESLPLEIRKELAEKGKRIAYLEDTQSQLMNKKNRMLEADYLQMDKWQEEMPSAIDKIKDSEEYQVLVKQDLHKLENEKQAYHFRKEELRVKIANAKGVALIAAIAGALCMIILLTLQMLLTMDVKIGYFLIVLLVAVTLTISYMMYTEYSRELRKVENGMNRLILLQNTVKIRYVNNRNLLDYYYLKYKTDSSGYLRQLWEMYQEEKAERDKIEQSRSELKYYQHQLVRQLRQYHVQDPNIWIHQAVSLYNDKEMVEIRHNLIVRRQKLRKQMEYNAGIAKDSQDQIKELVTYYPEYAKGILDIVSEYEKTGL